MMRVWQGESPAFLEMEIRKANKEDISSVEKIYEHIHTLEEKGELTIGWERNVYPTEKTALQALERGDLYVLVDNGSVMGSAVLNKRQVDVYEKASWRYEARDEQVFVMHTLTIEPSASRKGYGSAFVHFYEEEAKRQGASFLRMDTNKRNTHARKLYKSLGYEEIGIIPCLFNGIAGVDLVLLEKKI
ncbi:MAG: GNAT family N-acetyltransferase [Sphaerochaetaceae bacterium]|nr:GNAT family N-acetyltransferase [Sphaerochaetaceae bacterium]